MSPDDFAARVVAYFSRVHRSVFTDDRAANPNLKVEVVGQGLAYDTPIAILITPWTLCGLALTPDRRLPDTIRLDHRPYPVFPNDVEAIGHYHTVILVPDVSGYLSQKGAVNAAESFVAGFRDAVDKSRRELMEVADPDRRFLLKGAVSAPGRELADLGRPTR